MSAEFTLHLSDGMALRYRPFRSELTLSDGTPIDFDMTDAFCAASKNEIMAEAEIHSALKPNKKGPFDRVKIKFGSQCNMTCVYCCQAESRCNDRTNETEIDFFIAQILPKILEKCTETVRIEYWGGEPLLYWSYIKKVAAAIRRILPKARGTAVTNGLLLTREIAEESLETEIDFSLSYDGPGQIANRGINPLDRPKVMEALAYLHEKTGVLRFNCVLLNGNCSIAAVLEDIKGRLGHDDVWLFTEGPAYVTCDSLLPIFDNSPERMSALRHATFRDYIDFSRMNKIGSIYPNVSKFFTVLKHHLPLVCSQCDLDQKDTLVVELDGTVLTCQNFDSRITPERTLGSIDDLDKIDTRPHFTHWFERDRCRSCPAILFCKGGCICSSDAQHKKSCESEFNHNMAIFAACLFHLTGERLVRIAGKKIRYDGVTEMDFLTEDI